MGQGSGSSRVEVGNDEFQPGTDDLLQAAAAEVVAVLEREG